MLDAGEGVYLVLLVEVLYGGCQPAPVAIFTRNQPKRDDLNSNKTGEGAAARLTPPLLRLRLISAFSEGRKMRSNDGGGAREHPFSRIRSCRASGSGW